MNRRWTVQEENQLQQVSEQLLADFKNNRVFTFSGNLGSGKTTFIKYLCKALGVKGPVSSPTFALVNEYQGESRVIYHFDFYRIKNVQEAFDMGYEEYFYSGNYCFIEWPELVAELIPPDAVNVHIYIKDNGTREIEIKEK